MGRSLIVDAVSEMCRTRSVTHILLSPDTFNLYSSEITQQHIRTGVRRSVCHGVGIIVVSGMTDECMFSFNHKRAKAGGVLLELARAENYERMLDLVDLILSSKQKWFHTGTNPTFIPSEGEE